MTATPALLLELGSTERSKAASSILILKIPPEDKDEEEVVVLINILSPKRS